uniref:RING-type domain-containing protein n=1 Tax=viral metagenome TaxID=1070528 RepID=A0A6C0EZ21_9ZZZZ
MDQTEQKEQNEKEDECPICLETMKGKTTLECNHTFCIKCTISHFRLKNNCPLCRAIVYEKKAKGVKEINKITDNVLNGKYRSRNNLNLYDYIVERIHMSPNVECVAYEILNEVKLSCLDVGMKVNDK